MVDRQIRKQRCADSIEILSSTGTARFFTLTTPDVVDLAGIRERWRGFRHDLFRQIRKVGKVDYVMNYELHPGYLEKPVLDRRFGEIVLHSDGRSHGWHIHGVINRRLPADWRTMAKDYGFGRCHAVPVYSSGVYEYLTKHALKAYRGFTKLERETYKGQMRLRLVNASRGLPVLNDYKWESGFLETTRGISRRYRDEVEVWPSKITDYRPVYQRSEVCAQLGLSSPWQVLKLHELLLCRGDPLSCVEKVKEYNLEEYEKKMKKI